jgi:hypothetical protein
MEDSSGFLLRLSQSHRDTESSNISRKTTSVAGYLRFLKKEKRATSKYTVFVSLLLFLFQILAPKYLVLFFDVLISYPTKYLCFNFFRDFFVKIFVTNYLALFYA